MSRTSFVAAALLGLAPCAAQDLAWKTWGIGGSRTIGAFAAGIGDIDLDGHEDLAAIVHGRCGAPRGYNGYLWLLSGRTGTRLRELPSPTNGDQFSWVAAAGDWNGDTFADYITVEAGFLWPGGIGWSATRVRSGLDDTILLSVPEHGDMVVGNLDVDGDGLGDVVVSDEHHANWLGEVFVYAHDGTLLYRLEGDLSPQANPPMEIGVSIAGLGDVDDDGCDDFVMGCYETTGRGAGVVVSGRTGKYLHICYGELPGDGIGHWVDRCGDVDGDGYDDFAVGNGGAFTWRKVVRLFSGRSGQVLRQWVHNVPDFSVTVSSRGIDLDGDGMPEVLAGAPGEMVAPSTMGAVYAYSTRDGSLVQRLTTVPGMGQIGWWSSLLRAPAGGRLGSIVVPNLNENNPMTGGCNQEGSLSLYRGLPRTTQILGVPCPGNLAQAPTVGLQTLGGAGVRVHLGNAPVGVPAVLLLGLSTSQFLGQPLPAALGPLGFPGCELRTSIEQMVATTTGVAGQDAGYAALDLPYPVPASGLGTWSLSAQWVVLGDAATFPGGLSDAITWRH